MSTAGGRTPLIGVLALQGGFAAHGRALERCGARVREVRVPTDLDGLDGLVLPGGESTTLMLGFAREGLGEPLVEFVRSGRPVLATCAGMIVLDRERLGALDLRCERNAFGRQVHSFEDELDLDGLDGPPMRAVFIRAPWVAEHGPGITVLAAVDGHPVAVRQGAVTAVSFHPELTGDDRLHAALVTAAGTQAD
ncbi:pyridoxal 5'-phosphate synthase glutaminase subunit PdxT [Paraconexibacter sp.]|uniref:pyridoxal 5'-phosphate synthase glutaminase subunit PdxT n=1 Tax=Paraconexibacter sp. TaxID=2949640 RepID=UPI0035664D7C